MQHYINYGYGFPSSILKKEEFEQVVNLNERVDEGTYSLGCVPFTEDDYDHNWCCIVLHSLGEVNNYSKMLTLSEIKKFESEYGSISTEQKAKFLEVLSKLNLEKYIDNVELVFYSDNY